MQVETKWANKPEYFQQFERLAAEFIQTVDRRSVEAKQEKYQALSLADKPQTLVDLADMLKSRVMPFLSASAGPRYWGFVTGGATPVACFADWLVTVFDQNLSKAGDSIATDIEYQTLEWLLELYALPKDFSGVITTGATAANFLASLSFRQFAGNRIGLDVTANGLAGLEVEVFTASPHASMLKAMGMAGLGQKQCHYITTLPNSEEMDTAALAKALANSHSESKVVIASAGTVTTTSFDDLESIAELCHLHGAWLHVDGAFGIAERLLPGGNYKTQGIERADSITIDNHKWLNVPYESGAFFTRHQNLLKQSCHVDAPYLKTDSSRPDFMSLGVENSRRFRALPVWMSLLAYGKQEISSWVQGNVDQAKHLALWLQDSESYELLHPCTLNVVLFRPRSGEGVVDKADELTRVYLKALNRDGRVLFSFGSWNGQAVIRAALSNWQTSLADVDIAISALEDIATQLGDRL